MKQKKITVITLGCHKNTVEAEYLLGIFRKKNFILTANIKETDIVLIHTCSFIESARIESENHIRYVLKLKEATDLKVYVSGCLVQLLKEDFAKKFPNVDGFVGTGDLINIENIISNESPCDSEFLAGGLNESKYRVLSSGLPYAFIKIAEGCSHKCSFCIIPYVRGKYKSRHIGDIVAETKTLVSCGIREIILVAQDTTSFGHDIYGKFALGKLLSKLAKISSLKWIRLLYAYPASITDELINIFKEYETVCNYIDIPIQHVSPKMLLSMRRPLNTVKIIEKIKNKAPEIVLRTSLITGFPGESEEDILELINFLKQEYFQYIGVFEYSNEKKADSSLLDQQIETGIAKKRRILIENVHYEVFKVKFNRMCGSTTDMLVENCEKKRGSYKITGRSYFQSPEVDGNIVLESENALQVGKFYKIRMNSLLGYNINSQVCTVK
ncbi:MAG: 30S ribosomal protein S12 methylthiotransferase RimO [Elusimicrobiota bacterium]|jgi:ribosomal protein S12 methylthiotransferase|nr:30S ribosomal protein S12 methylthiotransferase RimO [Elusimicrobiota bacterium]